jgi:hypothetical protein
MHILAFLPHPKCDMSKRFIIPKLYSLVIHCTGSSIGLPRGPIYPLLIRYFSSANSGNLIMSRMSWSTYLNFGTFTNMSLRVGTTSGRNGRVISIMSRVFLFFPTIDVLASTAYMPSSSPTESGQSVMSSTNTSSCAWDFRGPTVSSGLERIFGLGFEPMFPSPELCPISP